MIEEYCEICIDVRMGHVQQMLHLNVSKGLYESCLQNTNNILYTQIMKFFHYYFV